MSKVLSSVLLLICLTGPACAVSDKLPAHQNQFSSQVRVGAFNIQSFGRHKMTLLRTTDHIITILARYDLVLVQEIRDKSETAIVELLKKLRSKTGKNYRMALSKRLGGGRHKEQLAYLYDSDIFKINYTSSPLDEDDIFYREPFIAKIIHKFSKSSFVAIGAHVSPKYVAEELEGIYLIAQNISEEWNSDKILVMGDLNASCDYITKAELANNSLRLNGFVWHIDDSSDTTIHDTNCAYDRIISSKKMGVHIKSDASVYKFDEKLKLSKAESIKISDHYPVEILLNFD